MVKLHYLFIFICNLLAVQQNLALERYAQATQAREEENIFESVQCSNSLESLPEKFCDKVIASYPKKVRQTVNDAISNELKQNCLILFGAIGTGKSLLTKIIAQKNGRPFLIVRSYYIENKTSENLCKIAQHAAKMNCNVIMEGIECLIKKEIYAINQHTGPLSDMLKILQRYNLLLIGATMLIEPSFEGELLVPLQRKIDVKPCKLEAPKDILSAVRTINAILTLYKINVDSPQTIVSAAELMINTDQRTIQHVIKRAYMQAYKRTQDNHHASTSFIPGIMIPE